MKKFFGTLGVLVISAGNAFAGSTGVSGLDTGIDRIFSILQSDIIKLISIVGVLGVGAYWILNREQSKIIIPILIVGVAIVIVSNVEGVVGAFGASGGLTGDIK